MKKIFKVILSAFIIMLIAGCSFKFDFNNYNKKPVDPVVTDSVIKEINDIDANLGYNLPLGIATVKLMSSGKVIVVPNDKNIGMGELTVTTNARDIYVLPFGNGGYRSILFVKNDNTVSAVNASSLIENKRIEVLDNLGGYTNVEYLESQKDDYASSINVVLDNGEKYSLDEYLK